MDLKSNHTAPVLTDPAPMNKSRLGIHSSLLPQYSPPGAAFSHGLFLTIPRKKTGVLDDVRSSCWLDAMKSSSPPHKKITKEPNAETDAEYQEWMVPISFHLTYVLLSCNVFLPSFCSSSIHQHFHLLTK